MLVPLQYWYLAQRIYNEGIARCMVRGFEERIILRQATIVFSRAISTKIKQRKRELGSR